MDLALIDGLRCAPQPHLIGHCSACDSIMIAKCGKLRAWHWAHQGERHCDPWWEESEWHSAWKMRFAEWREVVHIAPDGEKHIADVKLPDRRVLEFQRSPISEDERQSREAFYKSMIWIVDGTRRKRDVKSFHSAIYIVNHKPLIYSAYADDCALLRDWVSRPVDVVFDLGERDEDIQKFRKPVLWQLHPDPKGHVILTPIYTEAFVELLRMGGPLQRIARTPPPRLVLLPPPPQMRRMNRRHFRF